MTNTLQGVKLKSLLQPILLQGHERSITKIKYNLDGDLLFSASKDKEPCVWYSDSGERLGTYDCDSAVWDIDPSWDSKFVLTACADSLARMFDTVTGELLATCSPENVCIGKYADNKVASCRCVAWSETNDRFAIALDPFTSRDPGLVCIYDFDPRWLEEGTPQQLRPSLLIKIEETLNRATALAWGPVNSYLIVGDDKGNIMKFKPSDGSLIQEIKGHSKRINCLNFNKDKSLFITGSNDMDAKLWDADTLEELKKYATDRPVNGACLSNLHPHVILGGGQDAMSVTTTKASSGKFESRFYHMIYGQEFGRVGGHFGPINGVAIHPSGKSYTTGAEDGFMRMHHFDKEYLNMSDMISMDAKQAVQDIFEDEKILTAD